MKIQDLFKGIANAKAVVPHGGPAQTDTHRKNVSLANKHGRDAVKVKARTANQMRTFSKGPTKGPIKPR